MNIFDNTCMTTASDIPVNPASADAQIIGRIVAMRESVRRHRQKAIEIWNAYSPMVQPQPERASVGRFTKQLVQSE